MAKYNVITLANGLRVIHLPSVSPVVYCGIGYRAYNVCRFLMSKGYRVKNLGGGWRLINMHKGM